ncbi:MAG: DUF2202 domain-containing protein [Acidobacteria bacterium]|nr:DUF2202 domain-containing protein [Acidobacteriota bacterium]
MKKTKMLFLLSILALAPAVMAGGDKNRGDNGTGDTWENGCVDQPCYADAPQPGASTLLLESAAVAGVPDETEIAHLLFIREEEKLARDVYRVLYEKWGNPVFANIIGSEQAHMDAMADLLAFYGIEDPVVSDAVGAFSDTAIAGLFSEMTAWGGESEIDALLVGAFIEEYDILDLWAAYEETDEARIRSVYQNLYEGSYNHLDAFVRNYELRAGTAYVPRLLTDAQFDLVMAFATRAGQAQAGPGPKGK